jgi:hypothetical protein
MYLCLGMDEVNTHRIPEVYVMSYSSCSRDYKSNMPLEKGRKCSDSLENILNKNDVDFLITILYKEFLDEIKIINHKRYMEIKVTSIATTFIHDMQMKEIIPDNYKIYIDGICKSKNIKKCLSELGYDNTFIGNGDSRIPIINLSDKIAYKFFEDFILRKKKNEREKTSYLNGLLAKYKDKIIIPKIDPNVVKYFSNCKNRIYKNI